MTIQECTQDDREFPAARDAAGIEASVGIAAVFVTAFLSTPFPWLSLMLWVLAMSALHAAALITVPRSDRFEEARLLAQAVGWALALAQMQPGLPLMFGIAAFALVHGTSALAARRREARLLAAGTSELAQRAEAETAFLQAVDEIRRLRVDVKTSGDVHEHLSAALQESSSEARILRSKADALSATLQRVMPFETESGLLTADKFNTVLRRETARMQRQEQSITLVLVRLDHFTGFEQRYGRVPYEAVVRRVSEVMHKAGNRPGDVAARLGEDLFALLFPEAEHLHGLKLAEAVQQRIYQLGVRNAASPCGVITTSCGVATIIPNSDTREKTLRERAEAALYEASFQGGNRCVRYRVAQSARIEHWDAANEGALTLDSLRHKLALLGYEGQPQRLRPGDAGREQRIPLDAVEAVLEGTLEVSFEGEARTLRAGDLLFLPKGTVARREVIGSTPVLCLEATRV